MGIVSEIQTACKAIIETLTGFSQLDYEYRIELNSERGYEKRYGFIPASALFPDGRAQGFTTQNHVFQLILTDDFLNKDDDTAQNAAVMNMYEKIELITKELQKSRLALPTPEYKVLLISGQETIEPEFSEDNGTVVLRANFVIQYHYRNN